MIGLGKKKTGMTLIEIIIAIAILGLIAVAVLTMFSSGFSTIFTMGRKTQAINNQAQKYMDEIYASASKTATISTIDAYPGVDVTHATDAQSGLELVTITVDYQTGRTVTLKSLVPGL